MNNSLPSPKDALVAKCINNCVTIPYLFSLCPEWAPRQNLNRDEDIEKALEDWRTKWIENPIERKHNANTDMALFACRVYPEARHEELKIMALWCSWLYLWDELFDKGNLNNNEKEREATRTTTLEWIRKIFLGDKLPSPEPDFSDPSTNAVKAFYDIGVQIRDNVKSETSRIFIHDRIRDYVNAAANLQIVFDEGTILDLDAYMDIRMDSSGVDAVTAMFVYAHKIDLPDWFFTHSLAKDLSKHTNIIVSIGNDITSVNGELQQQHIDNLIPLLVHHNSLSPQAAIDHAAQIVRASYTSFLATEKALLELAESRGVTTEVQAFIRGCKDAAIGSISWMYEVRRYFEGENTSETKDIVQVLGRSMKTA